jgi:Acetyltransferase (GNAT) domain
MIAAHASAVHLRAAGRDDALALSAFLQRTFRLPSTAILLEPRHIAWKYWSDREDWPGPRSFMARTQSRIVAHVAAWPVRIRLPDRVLQAAHLIDWASDPTYPGAGAWLLRQVRAKTELLIATGGTEITRRTLPVLGFRPIGEVCSFARPLRPFSQARTTTPKTWRTAARVVRNSAWRLYPPLSPASGWSAASLEPHEIGDAVWPAASEEIAVAARDAAFYRYVLASPATRHALFGLKRRGELVGFFCLAYARHVARIADLWVASAAVDDWCAAFRTASAVAAQSNDIYEVTAWASLALGKTALARAGFRLRDCSTLSACGGPHALGGRELHVQMLDCDSSFLGADAICYLT